jgi:hypothetical protein
LTEPLLLVLPRADSAREAVALETLSDAPWIAGLAGTQFAAALEQACRSAGVPPPGSCRRSRRTGRSGGLSFGAGARFA